MNSFGDWFQFSDCQVRTPYTRISCSSAEGYGTGYRARLWMNIGESNLNGLDAHGSFVEPVNETFLQSIGLTQVNPPAKWSIVENEALTKQFPPTEAGVQDASRYILPSTFLNASRGSVV